MFQLVFHPNVSFEIKASYTWYQEQTKGLGENFLDELELAYQAIIEFPQTWPIFKIKFRRFVLPKFPFSVIYKKKNNLIYIIAVMNNSRKPGYWIKRI